MGNFYTNYTLRGPSRQSVIAALAGRSAIVSPAQDGCVVVYDEESEEQDEEIIAELAARLSGELQCPLLAVYNHDDSILWYRLYVSGELVDDYNSDPGYFAKSEEESMAAPEGGNARKLCEVFGSTAFEEVEGILRSDYLEQGGCTFAFERHEDLAGALGIPSFCVGGFEQISIGELPAELDKNDLVWTKDVVPPLSKPSQLDAAARKPVPGYYKLSFRATPRREASLPMGWAPDTWAELQCPEAELSNRFRQATALHRDNFKTLGFTEQGFKRLKRILNPDSRDRGGINYLDASRRHFGQLLYFRHYLESIKAEKEGVVISFTAVFQNECVSCTNNPKSFLEPLPYHKVTRMQSHDVSAIYDRFLELLKQRPEQPRPFPDLQSLQAWFDSNAIELFEDYVRRGWWVKMSDYEVTLAQRKLPPPIPNS
jgi:hypothetical protein